MDQENDLEEIAARYYRTSSFICSRESSTRHSIKKIKEVGFFELFTEERVNCYRYSAMKDWERMKVSEEVVDLIKEKSEVRVSNEEHLAQFTDPTARAQAEEAMRVKYFKFAEDSAKLGAVNPETAQLYAKDMVAAIDPQNLIDKLPVAQAKMILTQAPMAKLVYDPKTIEVVRHSKVGSMPILLINRYRPPAWRQAHPDAKEGWTCALPTDLTAFLSGLIPVKGELEKVLDFFAIALADRHLSMLHLRGARGNGKTVASKFFCSVIGDPVVAQNSLGTQQFNAEMRHKGTILIDDNPDFGSHKNHIRRRSLMNENATFQEKNVQSRSSEIQTASFICCSNTDQPFYETHDERRVIQPTVAGKKDISAYMDLEYMAYLSSISVKAFSPEPKFNGKELDYMAQVGHFLLNRFYENNLIEHKSDYRLGGCFWDDVLNSLGDFKRFFVDTILDMEEGRKYLDYNTMIRKYEDEIGSTGNVVRKPTMIAFLKDFTFEGEHIVDRVERKKDNYFVYPAAKYLKVKEEKPKGGVDVYDDEIDI